MPRAGNEYTRVPIDRVSDSPLDAVGLRCASTVSWLPAAGAAERRPA